MSQSVTFNGSVYTIPDVSDNNWGQNVTDYLVAIAAGSLQKTGGTFLLSADVDFGSTNGLKSLYYKTRNANPASAGQIRLANSDVIAWRNQVNDGDLNLAVNVSDQLTFNGALLSTAGAVANPGIAGRLALYSSTTAIDDVAAVGGGDVYVQFASVAANRAYTIPDPGADSNFIMSKGAQTLEGALTLSATPTASVMLHNNGDSISNGPLVDVRVYASLNAAVTAIGSTPTTLLIPNAQTLTANLVIPSTLSLQIIKGGSIVKASTYTITINGNLTAGDYQIFSGFTSTGDILFTQSTIVLNVKWFGALGNNSNHDEVAIQKALTSSLHSPDAAGSVYIPSGIYDIYTCLKVVGFTHVFGDGASTVINQVTFSGFENAAIYFYDAQWCHVHDFVLQSVSANIASNGIAMYDTHHSSIHDIAFAGFGDRRLALYGCIHNNFNNLSSRAQVPGTGGSILTPRRGVWIDGDTVTRPDGNVPSTIPNSNVNTFNSCSFDNTGNMGIRSVAGSGNTFIGCASQTSAGYGVFIDDSNSFRTTFINHYFEPGTYGTKAVFDLGNGTTWINTFGYDSAERANDASLIKANYNGYEYYNICPQGNIGLSFYNGLGPSAPIRADVFIVAGVWNFKNGAGTQNVLAIDTIGDTVTAHGVITGSNLSGTNTGDSSGHSALAPLADPTFTGTVNAATIIPSTDIYTVNWTDYSGTSTIVGFSAYTVKKIWYKKIGKLVFVQYAIYGTGSGTDVSFTLPYNCNASISAMGTISYLFDNNGVPTTGYSVVDANTPNVICTKTNDAVWINLLGRGVAGQFFYQTT